MVNRGCRLAQCVFLMLWVVNSCFAQEVKVLGLFGDRAFIKVDGKSAVVKVGQTHQRVTVVAVTAQQATLNIEGIETIVALGKEYVAAPVAPVPEVAPVETKPIINKVDIFANQYQQFIVGGMINSRIVSFLVDTGANTMSMTRKDAQRLGIDFRLKGRVGMSGTANGLVKNWSVILDKVKVGTISLSYVEATIRDTDDDMPILLGMSFLKRVKLEQANQHMTLSEK